jgi:hypothetical protein
MRVSDQRHALVPLPPVERAPGTHYVESLVVQIMLDAVDKRNIPCPYRELNSILWMCSPVFLNLFFLRSTRHKNIFEVRK